MREIEHRYRDPLDVIWADAAARIGLRIERSDACYASTDGKGTLIIGEGTTLDADDCLSQMVFHELCHSLVQGPESFERPDWGLDNITERDLSREHACLRLQALLAGQLGLRRLLAPTTDHRAFYDGLGPDPLLPERDPAVLLARAAAARVSRPPWAPHLMNALHATRRIAEVVGTTVASRSGLLWETLEDEIPAHATGLEGALRAVGPCGECAWSDDGRCVQAGGLRVEASAAGCARFEAALDCLDCGACCREAYGAVELADDDPFPRLHPHLVTKKDGRLQIVREAGRCGALEGGREEAERYRCVVYDDRPATCREFTIGRDNCLIARRRVGLSR